MDEPKRRIWTVIVGTLAGIFLGGVFLFALYGKVLDPVSFEEHIRAEHLEFTVPLLGWPIHADFIAFFALALEAGLGLALVLGVRRLWVLIPSSALILFFMFLTGRAYLAYMRGEEPATASCGCFGNLVDRTPAEAFWQDLALIVPAGVLAWLGRPRGPFPWVRTLAVGAATTAILVFAFFAPGMDLDDLATRLSPGVELRDLCVGEGEEKFCILGPECAPEFEVGTYIVLLADLEDEAFAETIRERIDELVAWSGDYENPPVYLLHSGKKDQEQAFNFRSGMPPFQYRPAPRALLRPLYRALPRTFVVEDGRVTRTSSGFPPLSELHSPKDR